MEREKLAGAVKNIAWGYVLLHINLSFGTLNVLPNWLGYVLILGALPIIGENEPSALLLRPLGIILALWEGLVWVLTLFGVSFDGAALGVIAAAVGLHFHFQLLTNLAGLAENCGCPEKRRILHLRTARTLLMTALALPIAWTRYTGLAVGAAIVNIIVALWICSVLFSLRRSLEGIGSPAEEE